MKKYRLRIIVILAMAVATTVGMAATGIIPASAQAKVIHAFTGVSSSGGTLQWDGKKGIDACSPGTTGNMLVIFNPHSDAVPTSLTVTWSTGQTRTYVGWTQSGQGQDWHLTVDIVGEFPPQSMSVSYTGTLGDNPVLTISGCNEGGTPVPPCPPGTTTTITLPGTTTTLPGSTTTITTPGTTVTTTLPGTTTTLPGSTTTVTTPGTTVTLPGTTTTLPGSTTTVTLPGTTTTLPGSTTTITTPGTTTTLPGSTTTVTSPGSTTTVTQPGQTVTNTQTVQGPTTTVTNTQTVTGPGSTVTTPGQTVTNTITVKSPPKIIVRYKTKKPKKHVSKPPKKGHFTPFSYNRR